MDEFAFINSIKQHVYKQPSLIKGIGDDAAVFQQLNEDIVTAMDTFVENVHFSRATMSPFHVGYRLLGANISDMAAMGAMPVFYLVSIVAPPNWSKPELQEIFKGMNQLANLYKMDLIGGDTVSGNELAISVTVIGYTPIGKARYRSTAMPGDILFVTGTLGDSAAGLSLLTSEKYQLEDTAYYIRRHRMPLPRVEFSYALRQLKRVALNDISDGIASEAAEIAVSSGVSITIKYADLPTSNSFHRFSNNDQRKWKLFGGEDFEILGAAGKEDWLFVKEAAEQTGTRITVIGYCSSKQPDASHVYLEEDNQLNPLYGRGYNHFGG